jgi:ABC-type antimicrobial peptide transport system permease subunit
MAFLQNLYYPVEEATFAIRAAGEPLALAGAAREIVHQADPRVPVIGLQTQDAMIAQTMSAERMFARLCTGFAILALAIACVGLYGTMTYSVTRRTFEIGIRMALGARPRAVVSMVMSEVTLLATIGLAIGMACALPASRFVESFLFGTAPNDPLTLACAAAILVAAALLAGYFPARRASRIDPMLALRQE